MKQCQQLTVARQIWLNLLDCLVVADVDQNLRGVAQAIASAKAALIGLLVLLSVPPAAAQPPLARSAGLQARMPSLAGATGWINSAPLTAESLRGRVLLVDFWTFSCINCLRTLPYVQAWADKYRAQGLVVIGVHAPEFRFEHHPEKLARAIHDLGISYPVAVDSDFAVWRAFGNKAWPAFYLVDAQGRIRQRFVGEGHYEATERLLQRLLAEAGRHDGPAGLVKPAGQGVQAAPDVEPATSPETYLGSERASRFVSSGGLVSGRPQRYAGPTALKLNEWSLTGNWTVASEMAQVNGTNGRIAYRFKARDLHMVLGPAADGRPVRIRVLIDGQPPLADHGTDIDAQGAGLIDRHRLYQLLRQTGPRRPRLFEIEFLDAGAQAYAFTFG